MSRTRWTAKMPQWTFTNHDQPLLLALGQVGHVPGIKLKAEQGHINLIQLMKWCSKRLEKVLAPPWAGKRTSEHFWSKFWDALDTPSEDQLWRNHYYDSTMTSPFLGIKFYARSWGDIFPDVNVRPVQSISENHGLYCDKSLFLNFGMCLNFRNSL